MSVLCACWCWHALLDGPCTAGPTQTGSRSSWVIGPRQAHLTLCSDALLSCRMLSCFTLCCAVSFMQRLDDFRAWALLGFLACPAALQGVGAQPLMAALLKESFLLQVHGDVVLPLHGLYQQHVTPLLEQLTAVLLESSATKANKQAQLQEARQLVSRCAGNGEGCGLPAMLGR